MPVWREILADTQTPVAAFLRLESLWTKDAFLLESVEGGERWARHSFLGGDSFALVAAFGEDIEIEGDPPVSPQGGERPLDYVRRLLDAARAPTLPGLPAFHGGAVGFLGYDCVRQIERLPSPPPDDLGLPDLMLLLTRTLVVFDHFAQTAFVITNTSMPEGASQHDLEDIYNDACARCDEVVAALADPVATSTRDAWFGEDPELISPTDDSEFARWVRDAKEHIYAGDVFQVVPSRRFETALPGSAFDAYRVLRALNPSPYMYFLRFAERSGHPAFEIAGSSPEPLVRVTGRDIVTRPIAGTRPRGATLEEDHAHEVDLLADEKERAEHIMLVDLARNDLGKVSVYGSVTVDDLMLVERYSHVMHIVSSVSGILAEGSTPFDALIACFPAGTVSGAPKVRAMELIDEMEAVKRGPYAGVVGYFDFVGNLDTCITIRTIIATGGRAYVQAGAGVVADSVAEEEAAETRRKASALLKAVAASRAVGDAR
ncbi:MAG TPA: anthranilate synthase component I [Actinomycetota bacterium]|nr:anthranilate synthase component I [Actinomycetota bacterium]